MDAKRQTERDVKGLRQGKRKGGIRGERNI
jgi:hypothetical protein